MQSIVIKGTYHVKGREPDGDSIAFKAHNPAIWENFSWQQSSKRASALAGKQVQLRIEAIDALETHYEGYSQPKSIAKAATHHLLTYFGVSALSYSLNFTEIVEADDGKEGTIVCKGLDGYDRPIVYAVLGDIGLADGALLDSITTEIVEKSINYQLASEGLAYPTFYQETDEVAFQAIGAAARSARVERRGIWAFDRTPGFTFWGPQTIYEDAVVLPKLFRRLVTFCESYDSWEDFEPYLSRQRDPFTIVSTGQHHTKLKHLVSVKDRVVSIAHDLTDIRFGEKQPGTPVAPNA